MLLASVLSFKRLFNRLLHVFLGRWPVIGDRKVAKKGEDQREHESAGVLPLQGCSEFRQFGCDGLDGAVGLRFVFEDRLETPYAFGGQVRGSENLNDLSDDVVGAVRHFGPMRPTNRAFLASAPDRDVPRVDQHIGGRKNGTAVGTKRRKVRHTPTLVLLSADDLLLLAVAWAIGSQLAAFIGNFL